REEREILKNKCGRPDVGAEARERPRAQLDLAFARLDEAGDHAEDGRLAATGRAEEREELALLDRQVQLAHGDEFAEALHHADEGKVVRHALASGHGHNAEVPFAMLSGPPKRGGPPS